MYLYTLLLCYSCTHMNVVAVLNQKGGSGKTPIATNLTSDFQRGGHRMDLVDADPQKTASEWTARGEATPPTYEATTDLETNILALGESFDLVVIDGAPRMTDLATEAVKAADLVLITVQPSRADIWAAADILDVVQARQKIAGGPDAAFIVSRSVARTNLADSYRMLLKASGSVCWVVGLATGSPIPKRSGRDCPCWTPTGKRRRKLNLSRPKCSTYSRTQTSNYPWVSMVI
jgi:chromosome partitioning protein